LEFLKKLSPKKFEAFCWYHLSDELKHPIRDFHRELISHIRHPRLTIAAPRGFAKSSYYSYFYPMYLALEFPGIKVLLLSATGMLAEAFLNKIKTRIEYQESILTCYGDQVGDKWSNEEIHLKNGSILFAKGAGKQIRGFRPDVIIGDDLETDEMVVSVEQRKKFDHWFNTDVLGTLMPGRQLIDVGTILHPESHLAELFSKPRKGWKTFFYQAIKPDGSALWPDEWSLERLDARRQEQGDSAFRQEYMNDPLPDHLRKFKKEHFRFFVEPPPDCSYFTTIDPAIEIKSSSDFTAIVTCAVDHEMNLYVVDVINKHFLPSETINMIFDVYHRYKPGVMGIETVGFQKMLKIAIDQEKRSRNVYPIFVELKSGGRRKDLRIEALQPWFESGKIFIKEKHEDLMTQLLRFPSPRCKDDIIDALAYQLDIIRPGKMEVEKMNPGCFLAEVERTRRSQGQKQFWGNHNVRNRYAF
jgi:predicted phage terminase large subunit-like protein